MCGKANFDFHALNAEQESDFVKKGEKACVFALSNAATRELTEGIAISTKVVLERFGHLLLAPFGDEAAEVVADQVLGKVGKSIFKSLFPQLAKIVSKVNLITKVGNGLGLAMVPYAAATHAKHVLKYNGCTGLLLDVDGRSLKVGGGLLYSPAGLNHPAKDAELTQASVWELKKKRFRRDEWKRRPSGLSCTTQGLIELSRGANEMFFDATYSLLRTP